MTAPDAIAEADRSLDTCGAVALIVYTVPPGSQERGYEPWLRSEDNPFFNKVPGVRHYANWRVDAVIAGRRPVWTHFDFFGASNLAELERAWFAPELDEFRKGWIRKWGYGQGPRPAMFDYAYLLEPVASFDPWLRDRAVLSFGLGQPPSGARRACLVVEKIRKHFSLGPAAAGESWRMPFGEDNPLGFDWLATGPAETASLTVEVSRIAGPDGVLPHSRT